MDNSKYFKYSTILYYYYLRKGCLITVLGKTDNNLGLTNNQNQTETLKTQLERNNETKIELNHWNPIKEKQLQTQ